MVAPGTNSAWAAPLRSVLTGLVVFLLGSLSDFWLQRYGANLSIALIDDALVGIVAGLLVFLYHRQQVRNVTERKLADEVRLRHSAIVESSDDAIMGLDANGTVVSWNKGAERLYGYPAKEAIGTNISFLSTAEDPHDVPNILERVINGEVLRNYETVRRRKDGTHVEISLTLSPIIDAQGAIVGVSGIARDITKLKQSEKALRESEERFRGLYENATLGLYRTTPDGKILLANPSLVKMLGFSSFSELAQRNLEEGGFEPGYERAEFHHLLATEGEVKGLETSWTTRDGTTICVRESAKAIRDAEGKIAYYEGTVEDITERKQAEQALKESESRFRLVANTAPVMIWMSGTDKLCTYFNKPWLDFSGRSMESELGNGWAEGVHSEDLQRCMDTYTQAFDRREEFRMEYRLCRHDGEYRWILDIGVPRYSPGHSFAGYIGSCIDVTDRKLAEEVRLRHSAIVESSDDAIIGADANGKVTNWNKGAEQLFGYSAKEATGRNIFFLSAADLPEDGPNVLKKVLRGEVLRNYETVRLRKDGTRADISLTVSPIFDAEGRIVGLSGIARDITERKRAEETRSRHSAIVESSEDAIISKNLDGIIQSWNAAAERIFGYTEAEAIGQPIAILIPTEFWDEANKILQRVMAGECIKHYETTRITKAGKRVDVSVSISPIKASTGRVLGASKIVRDITEQKLAEETLRKSEERFHLAAQAGKMFAYEWDVATDQIVRSPEAAQILGIDEAAQTTGQQILAQVHPDDRERLTAAVAALSPETPYLQISYRVARSDGAVIWVSRNSRGHFDEQGKLLRVVGMVTDITERKLAEEALRTSEERLRLAQWAARIGTFDLNLRTGVDIWPPETEALYGLPPGGFGGTLTAFENLIHPEDRQRVIELTREMMRTGQPTEAEWRVVWPEGSVHWIASRGQVFMDESGEPSRMLGVNIDITERKQAEEVLSSMTRKLVEAQEQERARIARELHDDINQRVGVLAIELDQLRDEQNELPQHARNLVRELIRQTSEIATDLHALSHELHSSTLDLLGVARAMKSWCKEFGERHKLEIDFKNHDVPKLPEKISLCLLRVLQEAVHNAAKHSGVKRIEVQLMKTSGEIHLIVSDSGKGFDIEAAGQSQGLGLTSMQERVRLVGGTIAIESKPMGGTTIHVRVALESKHSSKHATV